ncbi:Protein of unknown function [Gryllus bimaculatus]|nr:Protein of unknown function [Gryllus bimaculatus]
MDLVVAVRSVKTSCTCETNKISMPVTQMLSTATFVCAATRTIPFYLCPSPRGSGVRGAISTAVVHENAGEDEPVVVTGEGGHCGPDSLRCGHWRRSRGLRWPGRFRSPSWGFGDLTAFTAVIKTICTFHQLLFKDVNCSL